MRVRCFCWRYVPFGGRRQDAAHSGKGIHTSPRETGARIALVRRRMRPGPRSRAVPDPAVPASGGPGARKGRVARPGIRAAEVTVMPPGEEEGRAEPPRWPPLASGRPQPGVADAVHAAEVPGRYRGRWTVETWFRTPGPAPGSGTAGPAPSPPAASPTWPCPRAGARRRPRPMSVRRGTLTSRTPCRGPGPQGGRPDGGRPRPHRQGPRHRHRAPRRRPPVEAAAAARGEKGLAGTREAQPGHPGA